MTPRLWKAIARVVPVVAVLALLASISGMPPLRVESDTRHAARSAASDESSPHPVQELDDFMRELVPAMTRLGAARQELLRRAATEPDNLDAIQAPSQKYRDSILELRRKLQDLRHDIGPAAAQRVAGILMQGTLPVSRSILIGEIHGDLKPVSIERNAVHTRRL